MPIGDTAQSGLGPPASVMNHKHDPWATGQYQRGNFSVEVPSFQVTQFVSILCDILTVLIDLTSEHRMSCIIFSSLFVLIFCSFHDMRLKNLF